MKYWLIKSEPYEYSWDDLVEEGEADWSGIRNYQARNNLREMKKGDRLLYYHSVKGKEIVGIAEVSKEHYPCPEATPTTKGDWLAVDIKPHTALKRPVGLAEIKASPVFKTCYLVTHSRLSVAPFTKKEYDEVLKMSRKKKDSK